MKEDLISVIIPVYKVEKYLKRCVDSVIGQTYKNLEIILVDDGSPDGCPAICNEYTKNDKRIKVIHKKNGGLSDARNAGIDKSSGKYITFIDSDDYVASDYVEYLYNLLKKYNTKVSACGFDVFSGDFNKKINQNYKDSNNVSQREVIEKMLYTDIYFISACGKLYAAGLFDDIKFPVGQMYEDLATTYKVYLKVDSIACGYEEKYLYCVREDSITKQKFSKSQYDMILNTKVMTNDIREKYPEFSDGCVARNFHAHFSTYCRLIYDPEECKKNKEWVLKYIKDNGNKILKNPKVSKKDKVAFLILKIGEKPFKFVWTKYKRRKYKME